jgi:hypothetical protein
MYMHSNAYGTWVRKGRGHYVRVSLAPLAPVECMLFFFKKNGCTKS